jgi:hypothetical protein
MSSNEPLWKAIEHVAITAILDEKIPAAAELRVIADWIRKRHPLEPDSPTYIGARLVAAQLLAEADRAEAGE